MYAIEFLQDFDFKIKVHGFYLRKETCPSSIREVKNACCNCSLENKIT